jgi:rRNA maturation RNase YbeY
MAIRYFNDSCSYRLPEKRRTREWLTEVAREEGYKVGEINYIFCSAERHLQINRDFLGHDYYTDIITFDESDLRGEGVINGEIYIDVETVADNAAQFGATRLEEMRRVVVHGVLHLCGQKDKTPRAEREMHRKEDKYLVFWKR